MCYAAKILQGGVLFLERETHRVAFSQHLDIRGLDFHSLSAAYGFHQLPPHREGSTGGYLFEELFVEEFCVGYNLNIVNGRTVVEGDELYLFVASFGAYPSFGEHLNTWLGCQEIFNFGSFKSFHRMLCYNHANIAFLCQFGNCCKGSSSRYSNLYSDCRSRNSALMWDRRVDAILEDFSFSRCATIRLSKPAAK